MDSKLDKKGTLVRRIRVIMSTNIEGRGSRVLKVAKSP